MRFLFNKKGEQKRYYLRSFSRSVLCHGWRVPFSSAARCRPSRATSPLGWRWFLKNNLSAGAHQGRLGSGICDATCEVWRTHDPKGRMSKGQKKNKDSAHGRVPTMAVEACDKLLLSHRGLEMLCFAGLRSPPLTPCNHTTQGQHKVGLNSSQE